MTNQNATFCLWIVGLPFSGKSTLGSLVLAQLKPKRPVILLDGDTVREAMSWTDVNTYDMSGRLVAIKQYQALCKIIYDQGISVISCNIGLFDDTLLENRKIFQNYFQIHVSSSLKNRKKRDTKQLYSKIATETPHLVVGAGIPYVVPTVNDLTFLNDGSIDKLKSFTNQVIHFIES